MEGLKPTGRLAEVMDKLTEEQREALQVCMCDPTDSAARIARVLNDHGHPIGATAIKIHRAKLRENGGQHG